MINYNKLANSKPTINYDTTILVNKGYNLKFALDYENPDFKAVIERCKKNNYPYKIIQGEKRQKHIWIKGWVKE